MLKYCSFSALALALGTPAYADTGAADDRSDEIIVTASRAAEGVRASQLGSSVSVIDAEMLETRQTRIVSDILRDVPGLAINRSGAIGGLTQINVRGSESNHVLVLVDGIEVADPYQGEYDFGSLIADPAARIEILRGQQSSLYGSDAIGGVIHYVTLSGREAPGYSARIEGGSFGTLSGAVRAAGASDAFDYALMGSYYGTKGYPTARGGSRDIGSDSIGLSAKANWKPAESLKISAVLRYSETDADFNNSDYDTTSPTFGYIIDSPDTRSVNKALYGLLSVQHVTLDGRLTTALSGQFADTTRKSYEAGAFSYGDTGRRYKGSLVSTLNLGSEALRHRITGAVDIERETFRNITTSPGVFNGTRHADNLGFVGQYELFTDVFSLGASVRHDENDRFSDATTWRVQASYWITPDTRLRGAYGSGVKNPGYFELFGYFDGRYIGNPDLKPEKSTGWEIGIAQSIGGGDWAKLDVTWFDSTLKNEIYTSYPAPDFIATPANRTTESHQHGLEATLSARPIPQIRFDLAYSWLKARENGIDEPRRPRHTASFNATVLSSDERFDATLTLRYHGRAIDIAYIDPSYTPVRVSMKEYTIVNLGFNYRISNTISLFGRIENLLGEDYEELFSYATAGRAAYGGVRLRF